MLVHKVITQTPDCVSVLSFARLATGVLITFSTWGLCSIVRYVRKENGDIKGAHTFVYAIETIFLGEIVDIQLDCQ